MVLCAYGCGREGLVEKVGRGRVKKWICSPSSNSCPVIQSRKVRKFQERYGVKNPGQIPEGRYKAQDTMFRVYGDRSYNARQFRDNPWMKGSGKEIYKIKLLEKYGVDNPSHIPGVAEKRSQTMKKRYGVDGIWMLSSRASASQEAREYIRNYVFVKGYATEQLAYDDPPLCLTEWGTKFEGRWMLFDLVVFEEGHRGDVNHVIEILEYHGPWHYTSEDAENYPDQRASPYTRTTTVRESYEIDRMKERCAKDLTLNYVVIWPEKYRNKKWFLKS